MMNKLDKYDVIVIGGGHAGTEAALASARMQKNTLLITHNIETLGQMSCNPAIGGIGKSHLVKELDALGGAMALATDKSGIQFRVLNRRKGPAVRATRAQADRVLYKASIRQTLENQENLTIFQAAVDDLLLDESKNDIAIEGVVTQTGVRFYSENVVLSTGTFLGGKIHIGMDSYSGGRAGDPPSNTLSERLRELPFRVGRLKTGTPPRIDSKTVDFKKLKTQPGDTPTPLMSFLGKPEHHPQQTNCHIAYTNEKTHEIIFKGLDKSPLYSGKIFGTGPRYCPSIEDKVHRFAEKKAHQIFIEPEGLNTNELYPNGISTSLPFDTQQKLVRSIVGFESAHITRPGYAIEYDFFDPRDLKLSLETKHISGLFFCGQINGTTGYEEAAAQGLIAGTNAALRHSEKEPWVIGREEAYIGVMIDDLITLGTKEPYRMFTSRAEYRLTLREDNADTRLTEMGRKLGLVDNERWQFFSEKQNQIKKETKRLCKTFIQPESLEAKRINSFLEKPLQREYSLLDLLKRPEISLDILIEATQKKIKQQQVKEQIEINIKYEGYIDRQNADIKKLTRNKKTRIPENFDYTAISGLSNEVKQKLIEVQPKDVSHASRIPGITPAAISLLLVFLKRSADQRETKSA